MSVMASQHRVISQRELRNQSAAIMNELQEGQRFTITRDGHPVGELLPISGPREGVPTGELMAALSTLTPLDYQAMRDEMSAFFGDDDATY
jgi:antitoxin (DNA-binding transcriptional repressor) of toxin-antitoxin stability system